MNNKFIFVWIMILILVLTGCSRSADSGLSDDIKFLKHHNLDVNQEPAVVKVQIPSDWRVGLGEYPVGLYWGIANEYSKDIGLDITSLKGRSVEAHIYELKDGLPGLGTQAEYNYPSNAILILEKEKVVGAWLAFNIQSIGPSVKKRTLEEITGLSFEEWIDHEHYFEASEANADLANLSPPQVIDTFFDAINQGDKVRAHACLSPQSMLQSLTVNLEPGHLYHEGFNQNNSLAESIVAGKPIEYLQMYDPQRPIIKIEELGQRKEIGIMLDLEIEWKHPAFNTPDGKSIRFAVLKKYSNGWKIDGLGTGP